MGNGGLTFENFGHASPVYIAKELYIVLFLEFRYDGELIT